ncbi:hypothetical protein QFZ82_004989 [Streptomyces sp. V4I23]|uniref:hypothetical protein n=1 Tax=Streptomyces sp. V4I23 TaxID=3042282 RepID=UPI00278984CE|nr:hypothetical protein [Streptomyces sp. V4I23]MDQ1010504.1 hypothetical protein [Streptomyces sp. V4I23]
MGSAWMSRRSLGAVGLVLLLGAGTAACGEEPEEKSPYVATNELCDGLFEGAAAGAVETVMGATSFDRTGPGGMGRVVESLEEGYASDRSWSRATELCELSPRGSGGIGGDGKLSFSLYAPGDIGTGRLAAGERAYGMGTEAEAGPRGARLYFECVSPTFKGSQGRPARVHGSLRLEGDLEKDSKEHREAGLTVVHAASLAVAKQLKCEDNGGLPEKPVLSESGS